MHNLKTIVGHRLSNLFSDNVAFSIATFLVSSKTEIARRAVENMKQHYEKLILPDVQANYNSPLSNCKTKILCVSTYIFF